MTAQFIKLHISPLSMQPIILLTIEFQQYCPRTKKIHLCTYYKIYNIIIITTVFSIRYLILLVAIQMEFPDRLHGVSSMDQRSLHRRHFLYGRKATLWKSSADSLRTPRREKILEFYNAKILFITKVQIEKCSFISIYFS